MNAEVAKLNLENLNLQDEIDTLEKKANDAKASIPYAMFGLAIGIFFMVFFYNSSISLLGFVLVFAGLPFSLIALGKKRKLDRQIGDLRKQIKEKRARLIELSTFE